MGISNFAWKNCPQRCRQARCQRRKRLRRNLRWYLHNLRLHRSLQSCHNKNKSCKNGWRKTSSRYNIICKLNSNFGLHLWESVCVEVELLFLRSYLTTWNLMGPSIWIDGGFNWMIPNLYLRNGWKSHCFHPLKTALASSSPYRGNVKKAKDTGWQNERSGRPTTRWPCWGSGLFSSLGCVVFNEFNSTLFQTLWKWLYKKAKRMWHSIKFWLVNSGILEFKGGIFYKQPENLDKFFLPKICSNQAL